MGSVCGSITRRNATGYRLDSQAATARFVQLGDWSTLTVEDVVHGSLESQFGPDVSPTAAVRPRAVLMRPAAILPHLPCRIGLEGVEYALRWGSTPDGPIRYRGRY